MSGNARVLRISFKRESDPRSSDPEKYRDTWVLESKKNISVAQARRMRRKDALVLLRPEIEELLGRGRRSALAKILSGYQKDGEALLETWTRWVDWMEVKLDEKVIHPSSDLCLWPHEDDSASEPTLVDGQKVVRLGKILMPSNNLLIHEPQRMHYLPVQLADGSHRFLIYWPEDGYKLFGFQGRSASAIAMANELIRTAAHMPAAQWDWHEPKWLWIHTSNARPDGGWDQYRIRFFFFDPTDLEGAETHIHRLEPVGEIWSTSR